MIIIDIDRLRLWVGNYFTFHVVMIMFITGARLTL